MKKNSLEPFQEETSSLHTEWRIVSRERIVFGWRQWVFLAALLGAALLFAFGFLIITGVLFLGGVFLSLIVFLVRKFSSRPG